MWTGAKVQQASTEPDRVEFWQDEWTGQYPYCVENIHLTDTFNFQWWQWFHRLVIRMP